MISERKTRVMIGRTLIVFLVVLAVSCDAIKILCVFPLMGYSHYTIGRTLMIELAKRGHDITFVSPFPEKEPIKNFRPVILTGFLEEWEEMAKTMNPLEFHSRSAIGTILFLGMHSTGMIEKTLAHENVQKLLKSGEKFDIVLVEQFIFDGLLAIANHFGAPSGMISTFGPTEWSNHLVGNPDMISYMSSNLIESPDHTSFCKRVKNLLLYCTRKLYEHLYLYPAQNRIIQKYLPNSPHIYDMIYNVSLIIYNSDVTFHPPLPKAPNMIEIGGFHVQPPKKLPEDLQKILDNAKNGVVYFSMGSVLKSKQLPVETRKAILNTFSKLKETVLWKFEEDFPDLPSNVIIRKWFPQQDILAHPNVKLFITHGGLQSTIESVHRGVPMIGIPVFGDQKANMGNAVKQGYGVMVPLTELTEKVLTDAVNEVLRNPKYLKNVKTSSAILKDHQIHPIDKAEYWIEYVVRHNGAKHLRLASLDLAWYQHASIDVILFLTSITSILCYVFYRIIRWLLGGKKAKKEKLF